MLLTAHLTHANVDQLFSDEETIGRWIYVEQVLAQVQSELGMIPQKTAEKMSHSLATFTPNMLALQQGMVQAGVPIAALVKQLRHHVGQPHGDALHFGATTQDIMDTALVLQLRDAVEMIQPLLNQIIQNLAALADKHRTTIMAGRTHAQHAVPTTFGLKAANWLTPLLRQRQRLDELLPRLLVVQLGGAAGTLSAMGTAGLQVQQRLAIALGLSVPLGTWHAQRDTLVELANWLTLTTGALAKIAQDLILLSQSEVGEVHETDALSRGGSSTMPQKQNPMVSEALITIHRSNVGHLSTLQHSMLHAHERATDSWQAEWQTLPAMLTMTTAALAKAVWLSENIVINVAAMKATVTQANGILLAEAVSFALAEKMPRAEAKQAVRQAAKIAVATDAHLVDVIQQQVKVDISWERLRDEQNFVGMAEQLIDRICQEATSTER